MVLLGVWSERLLHLGTAGAAINNWFINPVKYSTAAQCLSAVGAFHPASVGWSVCATGQISEKPSTDSEAAPCSSGRASHRLVGALKSQKWPPRPGFWVFFMDIKLLRKSLTMIGGRLKVTDERGSSSSAGVEVGDAVPTGLWLTLLPSSTNTCMLFLGKTHVCYFRTWVTAGAFSCCLTFGHRKKAPAWFDRL